jgi:hypothetical protein
MFIILITLMSGLMIKHMWRSGGIVLLTHNLGPSCVVSYTPRLLYPPPPEEWAPSTHYIGDWVGPRPGLDAAEKRKLSSPCRESNRHYLAATLHYICVCMYVCIHLCEIWGSHSCEYKKTYLTPAHITLTLPAGPTLTDNNSPLNTHRTGRYPETLIYSVTEKQQLPTKCIILYSV